MPQTLIGRRERKKKQKTEKTNRKNIIAAPLSVASLFCLLTISVVAVASAGPVRVAELANATGIDCTCILVNK